MNFERKATCVGCGRIKAQLLSEGHHPGCKFDHTPERRDVPSVCVAYYKGDRAPFMPMHTRFGTWDGEGQADPGDRDVLYASGWLFRPGHAGPTFVGQEHTRYEPGLHGDLPSRKPLPGEDGESWWEPVAWSPEVS